MITKSLLCVLVPCPPRYETRDTFWRGARPLAFSTTACENAPNVLATAVGTGGRAGTAARSLSAVNPSAFVPVAAVTRGGPAEHPTVESVHLGAVVSRLFTNEGVARV